MSFRPADQQRLDHWGEILLKPFCLHKHKTVSSASAFDNDVLKHLTPFCCLCSLANKKS